MRLLRCIQIAMSLHHCQLIFSIWHSLKQWEIISLKAPLIQSTFSPLCGREDGSVRVSLEY